jgi:dolichol-phosphate mannosyltransferase
VYGESRIRILSRDGKLGLGSAYRAGLNLVKGKSVVLMDADLSHHPKFIPEFYRCVEGGNHDGPASSEPKLMVTPGLTGSRGRRTTIS